jgi:hypothetical protein
VRRLHAARLAAFLAAVIPSTGSGAPPPAQGPGRGRIEIHAEVLPDGTELIVLPIRSAPRASLRYVVRAGAAFDPPRMEGLAHLVEHVLASTRDGSERLLDVVGASGGVMNAFTSRDATWYALDAPIGVFPALAGKLLRAVSDPQFEPAEVNAVTGVVDSEAEVAGEGGFLTAVDEALFPEPTGSLLGSTGSRDRVTREAMLDFFRTRYVTGVTTVIVAGDLTPDEARALVEGSTAIPPALATERFGPRRTSAVLPIEQDVRAPFHAVVIGYRVDESEWSACKSAAELLNARLTYLYKLRAPVVAWADVGCHRLRGVPFLLTAAFARSLDEASLPDLIDGAYKGVVERPMTGPERSILEQRWSRRIDWLRESPLRAVEAATALATAPREEGPTPIALMAAPVSSPAELRAFAARTFIRERRVRLTFTPY